MNFRSLAFAVAALPLAAGGGGQDWAMNATTIEACSCPMFCQCYFEENTGPAAHESGAHYCRANNAYRINKGHYGATSLDGVKFWIAADLGADFSNGQMGWARVYFNKGTTPAQEEGLKVILASLFPVKWGSIEFAEAAIDTFQIGKDQAAATLDGGKMGEVRLHKTANAADPSKPAVIRNLKYWGAQRNDGFVLMPNDVEAYRVGDKAFEFKGTNGFLITFEITSKAMAEPGGM